MTREEAIEWMGRIKDRYIHGGDEGFDNKRKEAIDMAIEALQAEPVTYTFDVKSDKCEECAYKKTVEELSKGFEDYIIHGERKEP